MGRPAIVSPTDALEDGPRLFVHYACNDAERERPCGCGKEEVPAHINTTYDVLEHHM